MSYKTILDRLNADEPLIIMGHLEPDADCISSMLAIYEAFNGESRGWTMLLQDIPADNLHFLPNVEKIGSLSSYKEPIKRVLLLDCKDLSRANRIGINDNNLDELMVIDHHPTKQKSDLRLVDSTAASCCEIIYKLINRAKITISPTIALLLYTGLAGDTGCFRQSNTTSETLLIASKLLKTGFNPDAVRINLFERRSAANIKILGKALNTLESFYNGRLCFLTATMADKTIFQANANDCTSIVNYALNPDGAKIGVFFEEREENSVKISFRARNGYAVNDFAEILGGGGHLLAAGVVVNKPLEQVKQEVCHMIGVKYFGV